MLTARPAAVTVIEFIVSIWSCCSLQYCAYVCFQKMTRLTWSRYQARKKYIPTSTTSIIMHCSAVNGYRSVVPTRSVSQVIPTFPVSSCNKINAQFVTADGGSRHERSRPRPPFGCTIGMTYPGTKVRTKMNTEAVPVDSQEIGTL